MKRRTIIGIPSITPYNGNRHIIPVELGPETIYGVIDKEPSIVLGGHTHPIWFLGDEKNQQSGQCPGPLIIEKYYQGSRLTAGVKLRPIIKCKACGLDEQDGCPYPWTEQSFLEGLMRWIMAAHIGRHCRSIRAFSSDMFLMPDDGKLFVLDTKVIYRTANHGNLPVLLGLKPSTEPIGQLIDEFLLELFGETTRNSARIQEIRGYKK